MSLRPQPLEARIDDSLSTPPVPLDVYWQLMDTLRLGICLIDGSALVHFANAAAREILAGGHGIGLRGGRVQADRLDHSLKLRTAIAHVEQSALIAAAEPRFDNPVVITIESVDRFPLFVVLRPIAGPPDKSRPNVALQLHRAHATTPGQLLPALRHFELTVGERELAFALVSGRSLTEVAKTLKIKEATARGYLHNIFLKTGTSRQSELVNLLLLHAIPMTLAENVKVV